MTKWYVNAPGAESVAFDSEDVAKRVAAQVSGADVSKGRPKPKGRHGYADGSSSAGGIGQAPSQRKSLWQRLVG